MPAPATNRTVRLEGALVGDCFPDQHEDGDVVFLPKGLCGFGDGKGRGVGNGGGSLEAEEFPLRTAGLHHSIRDQRKLVLRTKLEDRIAVRSLRNQAQREAALDRHFYSVDIGSDVAGIRDSNGLVGGNAKDQAGREGGAIGVRTRGAEVDFWLTPTAEGAAVPSCLGRLEYFRGISYSVCAILPACQPLPCSTFRQPRGIRR
jgi:hypothetical protein